jgi:hypothetical protein
MPIREEETESEIQNVDSFGPTDLTGLPIFCLRKGELSFCDSPFVYLSGR